MSKYAEQYEKKKKELEIGKFGKYSGLNFWKKAIDCIKIWRRAGCEIDTTVVSCLDMKFRLSHNVNNNNNIFFSGSEYFTFNEGYVADIFNFTTMQPCTKCNIDILKWDNRTPVVW